MDKEKKCMVLIITIFIIICGIIIFFPYVFINAKYTENDKKIVRCILENEFKPRENDITRYDINKDGFITPLDYVRVSKLADKEVFAYITTVFFKNTYQIGGK